LTVGSPLSNYLALTEAVFWSYATLDKNMIASESSNCNGL